MNKKIWFYIKKHKYIKRVLIEDKFCKKSQGKTICLRQWYFDSFLKEKNVFHAKDMMFSILS